MNIEDIIHIISYVRNEYEKSYIEFSKQEYEELTERVKQIRELATLNGAIFALNKVLKLIDDYKKDCKE